MSIRPFRASDVEDLQRAANHYEVSKDLREGFPFPYTMDDALWWISRNGTTNIEEKGRSFAIALDDIVVGGIGIVENSPEVRALSSENPGDSGTTLEEIGYWLTPSQWNKGITTRALRLLIDRLRPYGLRNPENECGSPTTTLVALPSVTNHGSRRVLEHCGFVAETMVGEEHKTIPVTIKGDRTNHSMVYKLEL